MDTTFDSFRGNGEVTLDSRKFLFLLLAASLIFADLTSSPRPIGHCGAQVATQQISTN